jgi:hypothetical protein
MTIPLYAVYLWYTVAFHCITEQCMATPSCKALWPVIALEYPLTVYQVSWFNRITYLASTALTSFLLVISHNGAPRN